MSETLKLSPIQFAGYFINELHFSFRSALWEKMHLSVAPGFHFVPVETPSLDPVTISVSSSGGAHAQDPSLWRVELTVESDNPPEITYPYDFRVVMVGYFRVNFEDAPDNIELVIKNNCAAVLYSAAREALATATGRGPFPSVVLPSFSFAPTIAASDQNNPERSHVSERLAESPIVVMDEPFVRRRRAIILDGDDEGDKIEASSSDTSVVEGAKKRSRKRQKR
jgi:preprotein translocase subunit SecB